MVFDQPLKRFDAVEVRAVRRQKQQTQAPGAPRRPLRFDQAVAAARVVIEHQDGGPAQDGQKACFHRLDKLGGSQAAHPPGVGQPAVAA